MVAYALRDAGSYVAGGVGDFLSQAVIYPVLSPVLLGCYLRSENPREDIAVKYLGITLWRRTSLTVWKACDLGSRYWAVDSMSTF